MENLSHSKQQSIRGSKLQERYLSRSYYFSNTLYHSIDSLSMTFQEIKYGYNLEKKHKINHLLFIDDLRLYRKNERELNSFIITVNTFSEYTDVTFCMDKCKVLVIQQGRKKHSDGLKMPDGDPRK